MKGVPSWCGPPARVSRPPRPSSSSAFAALRAVNVMGSLPICPRTRRHVSRAAALFRSSASTTSAQPAGQSTAAFCSIDRQNRMDSSSEESSGLWRPPIGRPRRQRDREPCGRRRFAPANAAGRPPARAANSVPREARPDRRRHAGSGTTPDAILEVSRLGLLAGNLAEFPLLAACLLPS